MILQDPDHPRLVLGELAALLADPAVTRLRVAVAYVNLGGVRALQALLAASEAEPEVEVVVTLDMGITRESALEALLHDVDWDVRAITTGSGPGTFHAKVFVVDREVGPSAALVGSANLTYAALTTNHEAFSVSDLTREEAVAWEAWSSELTSASQVLTAGLIAAYSERLPPLGRDERIADEEIVASEDGSRVTMTQSEISADAARWLLIDWGGTGEYRVQLEIPKAPAAFFRPATGRGRPVSIQHAGREYGDNQLTFYPHNGMVRINMDPGFPGVQDRSIEQSTALFTRLGTDHYELRLVDRPARAARLAEAGALGQAHHTHRKDGTKRRFGWA